jgi:beta-lactam-binding protein with PASTA domain
VVLGVNGYRSGHSRVTVPSLVGQSVIAASEIVRRVGLSVVVADRRQDARIPPDMIIEQDPPPGGHVGKESLVRVVVSQGSGIVPDLRGLPFDNTARRLAQAAGLRLRRIWGIGDHAGDGDGDEGGTILFQLQAPGTHLPPDAMVDVVLGPRFKKTPDPVAPARDKNLGSDKD